MRHCQVAAAIRPTPTAAPRLQAGGADRRRRGQVAAGRRRPLQLLVLDSARDGHCRHRPREVADICENSLS